MKSAPLVGSKGNSPPFRDWFLCPFLSHAGVVPGKVLATEGGADILSPALNVHGFHLLRLMAGSALELLSSEKGNGEMGTGRVVSEIDSCISFPNR